MSDRTRFVIAVGGSIELFNKRVFKFQKTVEVTHGKK